jgi:hypothetical protein
LAVPSIALIGSFRKVEFYQEILRIRELFRSKEIEIASPQGNPVIDTTELFVRFEGEFPDEENTTIQSYALHRILRADAVYVIALNHYVGNTTCYEIGRIVQASRPIYFSEEPHDLPIRVPTKYVVTPEQLADLVLGKGEGLSTLHQDDEHKCSELERKLLRREYVPD